MAAQFEIRQQRLDAARRILGIAIGTCPKDKLFKTYIDIEHSLGNMDRYITTRLEKHFASDHRVSVPAAQRALIRAGHLEVRRDIRDTTIVKPIGRHGVHGERQLLIRSFYIAPPLLPQVSTPL